MDTTSSSPKRRSLAPQREVGRQRVAELMQAAEEVIRDKGYEAATMAEIAERADARIGSLYRFFPNKEAIGDALADSYTDILRTEYEELQTQARHMTTDALGDLLVEQLVRLHPKTRAVRALLDSRTDWTEIRLRFRVQALVGIAGSLKVKAPHLNDAELEDMSVVVLNNMKILVGMISEDAPTSCGAPEQLKLMNRLYFAARLAAPTLHEG